jgi:lysophospholipase L1-like esterase
MDGDTETDLEIPDAPPAGLTMAMLLGLVIVFSVIPFPRALRPFPELTSSPLLTLRTALWPTRQSAEPEQPVDDTEPTGEKAMVFDAMDFTDGAPSGLDPKEATRWELLISKVQAAHAQVEDNCREPSPNGCTATSLAPFFNALRGLADNTRKEPVRVVTIGTSLIASDHITDVTRRLLQTRHGSGGLGFMYVTRPTRNAGRTVRSGTGGEGWNIEKITDDKPQAPGGFAGVAFTAPTPQETSWAAEGTRRAELFLLTQPRGGSARVFADDAMIGEFKTDGPANQPMSQTVAVPAGTAKISVKTAAGPVRLDGVALETGRAGVVFDSLGLPGASAQVLLREDERLFAAQLDQRKPSLVILMIGGNDAFDMSLGRYTAATAQKWMQELITRIKTAAPASSCLLASPPDAGIWRMDKTIAPRQETKLVSGYMRQLARDNGCAYYDMQAAMGGEGAIERWWKQGLMNRDLVHPLATGGDVMGYLLEGALEKARLQYEASVPAPLQAPAPAPAPKPGPRKRGRDGGPGRRPVGEHHVRAQGKPADPADGGLVDGGMADTVDGGACYSDGGTLLPPGFLSHPESLAHFFQKLNTLETTKAGRVAIAQLGASHTAAQFFTDEMRRELSARFGYAGRGFVAAGKASNRLEAAGVSRELVGDWKVTDALGVKTCGLTWGLTGVRAEAAVGASLKMSFDEPGAIPDDTARLQIYYQENRAGIAPEIRIDGNLIDTPSTADAGREVRVLELGAPGGKHDIKVTNPGPGPLSVFGVSHELMKPGIVYDAFGLPGSTATTLACYAQLPLAQQLEAREVDLFVLFYGTNESSLHAASIEEMKRSYPRIIATLRASSPNAECLFLGPTDRMSKSKKNPDKPWHEAESINEVYSAIEDVAAANGCAFWDTRDMMGGKGSIERWRQQHLALRDHVHLTNEGYQKLAGALMSDLMRDYEIWRLDQ